MKNQETFTIVRGDCHYDTYDEKFYNDSWERTQDTYKYLKLLIKNNLAKFEKTTIENSK